MRRYKLSKKIFASFSPNFLKKLVKQVFRITDQSKYAYKTDGNNAFIRVKNETFRVLPLKTHANNSLNVINKNLDKISKVNLGKHFADYLNNNGLDAQSLTRQMIQNEKNVKVYGDYILTPSSKQLQLGQNKQSGTQGQHVYDYVNRFNEKAQKLNGLIDGYNKNPNNENIKSVQDQCTKLKLFLQEAKAECQKTIKETDDNDTKIQANQIIKMIEQSKSQLQPWLDFDYNENGDYDLLSKIIKNSLGIDVGSDQILVSPNYIKINNKKYNVVKKEELENKLNAIKTKYGLKDQDLPDLEYFSLNLDKYNLDLLPDKVNENLKNFEGNYLIQE